MNDHTLFWQWCGTPVHIIIIIIIIETTINSNPLNRGGPWAIHKEEACVCRLGCWWKAPSVSVLSQGQAQESNNYVTWTVIQGGWKIRQGPKRQGCGLEIVSKNSAKKQYHHNPGTSVLTHTLAHLTVSNTPTNSGSQNQRPFRSHSKVCFCSSVGPGDHTVGAQGQGSLCFACESHLLSFISS